MLELMGRLGGNSAKAQDTGTGRGLHGTLVTSADPTTLFPLPLSACARSLQYRGPG